MKIKKIVTYFKQSTIAADALRKLTPFKLIQSIETRWNSMYNMLQRFILLPKEIASVLLNILGSPDMLTAVELQLANEIVEVLCPVEKATREVCGQKFVTMSKVIPLISCIKNRIETLENTLKTPTTLALVDRLKKSVSSRFQHIENNYIMTVSTILDPRFKEMHFTPLASATAINHIARWMKESIQMDNGNHSTSESGVEIQKSDLSDDLWSFHDQLLKDKTNRFVQRNEDELPTDLKHYISQSLLDQKSDVLRYWLKECNSVYPTLSLIATKYLAVVATSVPSERLFSIAGNIMTEYRSQLSPTHLQQ